MHASASALRTRAKCRCLHCCLILICVQCKLVREREECATLQMMMFLHMEALQDLNDNLGAESHDAAPTLDLPALRLLEIARQTAGRGGSSIARFSDELGAYVVDPATEGRIVCMPLQ